MSACNVVVQSQCCFPVPGTPLRTGTKWATFAITLQEPFSVSLIDMKHINMIKEHRNITSSFSSLTFFSISYK